ncbi:MAG: hypothetical protein ACUVT7_00150 [Thermoplasmata archaeon]
MPAKKAPVVRKDEQITPLTDVITSLDSVRAYRRRSSQNLREKFERLGGMGYPELRKLWWAIEDDVGTIVDMPMDVPRVPAMIRLNFYLRLVGRIFFILLVIVLAARLVRAWRPYLGGLFGESVWVVIIVVIGSVGALNAEVVVDYLIRRKIVRYEAETEQKYAKQVASLKKATQTVIDQLAREVKRSNKDAKDFPFHLFFDDYDGIEVISTKTPRSMFVFKKRFKIYTAVVRTD